MDPVAWVVNLDADLELGARTGWTSSNAVRAAVAVHAQTFARLMLRPCDVWITDESTPGAAKGLIGRAFCPTPRARALLARVGATLEPSPAVDVIRKVNARAFCASLGVALPESVVAYSVEQAILHCARMSRVGRAWRVKRAFGMSGRGQRVIASGTIESAECAWVSKAIDADGYVVIEPHVCIEKEFAMHGAISPEGCVSLGACVEQRCDARGQWLSSHRALDVAAEIQRALSDQAAHVGKCLYDAQYFGPFGIDAFTYRDLEGNLRLQALSEINARFSMGYAVGMGVHQGAMPTSHP